MGQIKHGNIRDHYSNGVALQPNYALTYKDDGSIEGTVVYEADIADVGNLPNIGSPHPRESKCELYAKQITYAKNNKVVMTGSYFGIVAKETDPVLTTTTNADRLPIELLEHFSELGGTSGTPLNGAKFDPETGEFLGFFDPSKDLFGTQYFFSPSVQVSLSYWTRKVPELDQLMTIHAKIPGYKAPPNVKDFLLIGQPYRQIGTHYQITKNFLGSGPNGWNPNIYK